MFDQIAILDWSAAKGSRLGKDSIWLGVCDGRTVHARNFPNRTAAQAELASFVGTALKKGQRLLIGADFAFGFPAGFASVLTGQARALAVWDWLSARVTEGAGHTSNYRAVAAEMNAGFPGFGPFWGNGERSETPGLPRLKPSLPAGLAAHRHSEILARESGARPKSVWQLAGAGAVGAQVLTGLPVLNALRVAHPGQVAVWPFEPPDAQIVMAEVYPSVLHPLVRVELAKGRVQDEAQVSLLALSLARLAQRGTLGPLFNLPAGGIDIEEEGWLLGAGQSRLLLNALTEDI